MEKEPITVSGLNNLKTELEDLKMYKGQKLQRQQPKQDLMEI